MNQFIEPPLSHSLPHSLSLSYLFSSLFSRPPFSRPPIFSSFASRSVLSWNIYSSPGPASLNRHTNSSLNIAGCSLHAFPSVSSPKTQRSVIHTGSSLAMSASASPGSFKGCCEEIGCRQGIHTCPMTLLQGFLLPTLMRAQEDEEIREKNVNALF